MIGQTLSHFEILEKLGEGGMGVVYTARDTHLGRIVAVKALSGAKAADAERRKRFVQEARAASALNHPNIVTIHEIFVDNGTDFIVMEFVAGKTLDQLIGRRGMRVSEALKHSVQMADALAKAHAAGIVHRDLKPANIMIGDDGQVKILDFGLAKLTEPEAHPRESQATRPMELGPQTEDGTIVGTVAYMSPEQAEGRGVDARSDIFSFGAVLYEMLTGRRAFEGSSKMATLASVIREEPKPLSQIVPSVPRDVEKLVARCLRKDPERRAQHMSDVKLALEELKEDSESGQSALGSVPVSSQKRGRLGWIIAVGLILTCATVIWLWKGRTSEAPGTLGLRQLTADDGLTTTPAISSDGRLVAYASDRATQNNLDIWVHPLTQGAQPFRLTKHEADDLDPSFSPDSGLIVFSSNRDGGGIYVVPTLGGEERLLARFGTQPRFSPDGKWVVYRTGSMRQASALSGSKVYLVPAGGGSSQLVAPNVEWARNPIVAPNGRHILFEGATSVNPSPEQRDWWLAPIDGGPAIRTGLLSPLRNRLGITSLCDWAGDQLLFSARQNLWSVGFNPRNLKQIGEPRQLTSAAGTATASAAIHVDGELRIAVAVGGTSAHLWKLKLDWTLGRVSGPIQALSHAGGSQRMPASSADGSKLAYLQSEPSGSAVRIRDLPAGTEKTLVSALARAKLSPDGSQVAYFNSEDQALYLASSRGGDASLLLRSGNDRQDIYGWSPDGKKIVYWHGQPIRFSLLDLAKRQSSELISHPRHNIHGAEFSPDQQWVTFHTPLDRSQPIWIAPMRNGKAAGEPEWLKVADGGVLNARPWWSPDGNLLYFVSLLDGFRCIWAQPLDRNSKRPVGEPLAIHHLHQARIRPADALASFGPAILPDGIIFSLEEQTANIWITEAK